MRFPVFSSRKHRSRSHDPDDTEPFLPSRLRSKNPPIANKLFTYFPCVLNLLLGTTLLHLLRTTQPRDTFPRTYSPAHVSTPKNVVFTSESIYKGPSTPERDAAWEELYTFGISQITSDDAKKMVNRTMRIPGETGNYVVGLSVFRQLRCLDMLRKHVWSSSPSTGNEQLSQCLDALRQSVMCANDVTPLVWEWDEKKHVAREVAEVQHTCTDFEKVREWGSENYLRGWELRDRGELMKKPE